MSERNLSAPTPTMDTNTNYSGGGSFTKKRKSTWASAGGFRRRGRFKRADAPTPTPPQHTPYQGPNAEKTVNPPLTVGVTESGTREQSRDFTGNQGGVGPAPQDVIRDDVKTLEDGAGNQDTKPGEHRVDSDNTDTQRTPPNNVAFFEKILKCSGGGQVNVNRVDHCLPTDENPHLQSTGKTSVKSSRPSSTKVPDHDSAIKTLLFDKKSKNDEPAARPERQSSHQARVFEKMEMKIDQLEIENNNLKRELALAKTENDQLKQKDRNDDLIAQEEKAKEDHQKLMQWVKKARSDKQHRDNDDAHDNVAATTNNSMHEVPNQVAHKPLSRGARMVNIAK